MSFLIKKLNIFIPLLLLAVIVSIYTMGPYGEGTSASAWQPQPQPQPQTAAPVPAQPQPPVQSTTSTAPLPATVFQPGATDQLLKAIGQNNKTAVLQALNQQADPTAGLYRAIELNNPAMVELMLARNAQINLQQPPVRARTYQPSQYPPLAWATFNRYTRFTNSEERKNSNSIIQMLLQRGANTNDDTYSILVHAIKNDDTWLTQLLFNQYAGSLPLHIVDRETHLTPLLAAAHNGDEQLLLDITTRDINALPLSLIQAVSNNDLTGLEQLSESGSNIMLALSQRSILASESHTRPLIAEILSTETSEGNSALSQALQDNNIPIARWLLAQNVNIDALDLLLTQDKEILTLLVQAFIQQNPDLPLLQVPDGGTLSLPLFALNNAHYLLAQLLVENNIHINASDNTGLNILMQAISHLLLAHVTPQEKSKLIALIHALLQSNINLDHRDSQGNNFLHYLAVLHDDELVKYILSHINPSVLSQIYMQNNNQQTPIDVAEKHNNPSVAALLKEAFHTYASTKGKGKRPTEGDQPEAEPSSKQPRPS